MTVRRRRGDRPRQRAAGHERAAAVRAGARCSEPGAPSSGARRQPGPGQRAAVARSPESRPSRPPQRAAAAARRGGRTVTPTQPVGPLQPAARWAHRAAGRSPTRSCCANPAARTCPPTAPARRATTRSSQHLEAVRRNRPGRLPGQQGRAGRGRDADLERRRRGVELGLRRNRRHSLTVGSTAKPSPQWPRRCYPARVMRASLARRDSGRRLVVRIATSPTRPTRP